MSYLVADPVTKIAAVIDLPRRSKGPISTKVHRSKKRRLLDHLVGGGKQRRRNTNAERFCGFEIDDKLEVGELYYW